MKKIILLFTILVSITINSLNAQITNGGFESWSGTNPDGWVGTKTHTTGLTISKVTTDVQGGTNACGLTNTSASSRRFSSVATSVTNGTAYQISFWIKGTGQVRTGMYTGINGSTGGYLTYNSYVTVTSSWTKVSQFLTSDGTVSVAEFIISLSSLSDVIIDDVEVTESTISNVTIYQIQNSTGDSPYMNQVVNVYGTVTALHYSYEGGPYKGYFIQDGSGAFSGIYVYDQSNIPSIGDYISIIANVTEYNGLTELTQISGYNLYSINNYLPYPEEVTALQASGEEYEGVLIKIYNAKNTSSPTAYNDFTVNDGTSDINVDDDIYKFIPTLNSIYNITGIGHYAYNTRKILPRSSDDVVLSYNLYISDNTVCPNTSVSFSVSGSNISSVNWNFGDGSTGSYNYISHTYSTIGTYPITATVTDYGGSAYVLTDTVYVGNYYTPINYASMYVYNEPACPNSSINFDASGENISSYLWNFGDGTSSTSHYPSHSYSQVGTYPVSVKMTNYCGTDTILYYTVHIVDNLPYSGSLYLSVYETTICPNQSFNYSADTYGNSFVITFGDGTSSTQYYGYHSYSSIGTYTISLTATDGCGNDSTIIRTIDVNNNKPVGYAYLDVYNEQACPNTSISFYADGEDINSYLWNFGDGSTSSNSYTSHSYSQIGTYPVTLKMTNYCGNDTILYYTVHIVNDLPYSGSLNLSLSTNTICPNQDFSYYTSTNSNNIIINFGDGTTSTQSYGNHSYSSVGTYTISLTATNGCGNDSTISETIIVDDNIPIYDAGISVSNDPSCPNTIISFYSYGNGAVSYLWNFGDGTSSTSSNPNHSYSQVGSYPVSVKITNQCGNDTILFYTVHIENNIAYEGYIDLELYPFTYWGYEFGFDSVEVCPNQPVKYKGTAEGSITINFGDGTTSTQLEGSHTYSALGTYIMTLTATNGCGSDSTVSVKVTVKDSVNFYDTYIQVSDSIVCPNTDIQFEAYVEDIPYSQAEILSMSISSYLWNFGDGTTSTDNNPEHSYSTSGNYSVSLKLTNYCGNDTTIYRNITIGGNLPYSDEIYLSLNASEVCPNQSFEYFITTDGNDFVVDFGDGTSSTQSYSSHSYSTIGTYTITLTATNSCGNDTSVSRTIVVSNNVQINTNYISVSSNSACPGDDVSFYVNNNYASYSWDFGDGTTSSGYNPAHQYDSLGTYDVNVTITNHCGNQKVLSTTVTISGDVQISNFGIYSNPNEICPGESVMFDAWLNQDVEYLWNFGDGSTSNLQNPQHTFNNAGTYNVVLTVSNSCGNQGSDSLTILVGNDIAPTAYDYEFGTIGNEFCTNDSVMFYVFPTGNSYLWDFGDSSSTTQTVEYLYNNYLLLDVAYHKYSQTGTYNVSLTLTNSCGYSFTEDFNITIGNDVPINGDIYYDNSNNYADEQIHFEAIGGSSYIWNFGDGTSTDTTTGNITEVYHVFANAGTYIVSVVISNECGNSDTLTTTIVINQSNSKEITSFTFASLDPDVIGVINQDDLTIQATVPFGTVVTSLSPTIVHTGVSISPTSAVAQDFTTPKTYIVTADNGTTKTYTVTVNIAPSNASTQKAITSFSFQNFNPQVVATINETAKTINATVPYGSILTNLVATFTHTGESVIVNSIEQISGTTVNDFSSSLNYTVIAENASTATYSVNVVVTGIEEIKAQLSINIYPNPNNGNFTLEIENANNKSISLQIFDISGRNIFNQKFENKAVLKENINVSGLESGIYLVKILDGENGFYKRILINR